MKRTLLFYAIAPMLLVLMMSVISIDAETYTVPITNRTKVDLSAQSWKFISGNSLTGAQAVGYSDAAWATVTIPHTWNSHADKTFYTNCWYRTNFTGSSSDTIGGKRFYLFFEAVSTVADVYLNGVLLGQHKGAYTAFIFDATAARKDGDNVLAVKVDNNSNPGLPGQQAGWMHFGGIHRKVWSMTTDKYNVDPMDHASPGVFITQKNVSIANADLSIKTMVRNSDAVSKTYTVKNIVCDNNRTIVASFEKNVTVSANSGSSTITTGSIANPVLWDIGKPYLYTVYTEVMVDGALKDMVPQRIGLRYYSLTTNNFTINGKQNLLRGVCMHEEDEFHGNAIDSSIALKQFGAIQDLCANYVRLAHYSHPEFTYNLADERGIGISTEVGDWQSSTDLRNADRDNNVIEMVTQKFNHPSILFWCAGNEVRSTANVTRWAFLIDSIDGSKPQYFATDGRSATGVDFMANNTYPGWYDQGNIESFPSGFTYVSESGAGSVITSHQDYKTLKWTVDSWEPEEYAGLVNEFKFQYIFNSNPTKVPLYTQWVLFDFCDTKYKGLNTKGLLTYGGMLKDICYLWKAKARASEPVVWINGKHWYVRADVRDVKVYSNRASISLSINGVAKGTKADGAYKHPSGGSVINGVFLFEGVLDKGKNVCIASDGAGASDTAIIYYTGSATSAPADNAEYITNLTSSNANNPAFFVNIPVLAQWPVYYQCDGNADNSFSDIPPILSGARWIATKRQSGAAASLSFKINTTLTTSADVFIMCTKQASAPSWITSAGFTNTNVTGKWRDNAMNLVSYQLFSKSFAPGASVTLGSSAIDFVVLIKPTGSSAVGGMLPKPFTLVRSVAFKAFGMSSFVARNVSPEANAMAVYNLSGKLIYKITGEKKIESIKKISGASNSIYIVRLETNPE